MNTEYVEKRLKEIESKKIEIQNKINCLENNHPKTKPLEAYLKCLEVEEAELIEL